MDDEKKELLRVIGILDKANHNFQKENKEYSAKLQKAEAIINKWLRVYNTNTTKEVIKESEDFLKEE